MKHHTFKLTEYERASWWGVFTTRISQGKPVDVAVREADRAIRAWRARIS